MRPGVRDRSGLPVGDDVSLSREIYRREARRALYREARVAVILVIALAIGISLFGQPKPPSYTTDRISLIAP